METPMKYAFLSIAALLVAPVAAATDINVTYSEDFQEALEEEYGLKEGELLSDKIKSDLEVQFNKRDLAPARVDITIVDAQPNRPTFKQLTDRQGLDFSRSISLGDMDLQAEAFNAEGESLGSLDYNYRGIQDIRFLQGVGVWHDARRSSDRFARKFAKQLAKSGTEVQG